MTQDAMQAIFTRNAFYRRLHYYALAVLVVALIVIGILIGTIYYISGNYFHPLYFATDDIGRLVPIVPVSRPNMSDDEVMDWAVEAVQAAYSYDYVNYHGQFQHAQKYFTEYGWSNYMDALQASNNLLSLQQYKQVVVSAVVSRPTILNKGTLKSGAYAWQISMPLLVTYLQPPYDDTAKYSNAIEIKVIVQREPVLKSYKGLGIVQLIGTTAAAPQTAPSAPVSTTPT